MTVANVVSTANLAYQVYLVHVVKQARKALEVVRVLEVSREIYHPNSLDLRILVKREIVV